MYYYTIFLILISLYHFIREFTDQQRRIILKDCFLRNAVNKTPDDGL